MLDERAESRDEFHRLDVPGAAVKQVLGADKISDRLCSTDRNIQAVLGE